MAEYNNLYQHAIYWDTIFNRDVSKEVQFIQELFRKYAGRELCSVLDIACGPGYHARAFARQGLRAVGLDLRDEMLAFARDQAEADGVSVQWISADMRSVTLDQPVDTAVAMFDAIDGLLTDDDLINHFRCIGDNLTPGGIYVVELSHPAIYSYEWYPPIAYHGQRDGVEVDIYWATNRPQHDLVTGVAHVELDVHVTNHGQTTVIHDSADERMLCAGELRLLARLSGTLEVVGWYGDVKLTQPFDHTPMSQRMICVMQKR